SFLFSNFLPMAATSLPPTLTESFIFGQRRVGKRSRQRKWRTRRHETDRGRGCRQIPWRKFVRQEAAQMLGISADTAKDNSAHARAWLFHEITKSNQKVS